MECVLIADQQTKDKPNIHGVVRVKSPQVSLTTMSTNKMATTSSLA